MSDAEFTAPKQVGRPFQPGQSGNPAGRPKGARSKLAEDFLGDVLDAWQQNGRSAIDMMIADKPGDFVKMVAGLMPKEATLNINDHSEMTDDELAERVRSLAAQLTPFLLEGVGTADAGDGSPPIEAITSQVH